jgi:hypothetical protein
MTLKSRLSQLQAQAGATPTGVPSVQPQVAASLQNRLGHLRPERLQGRTTSPQNKLSVEALAQAVKGEVISEGLIRIEACLPLNGELGIRSLNGLRDIPLLPGETEVIPGVYIDTETTGLSGGSGTLAFLAGMAVIEASHLKLTQWLITCFAAESALLCALEQAIPASHRLISYNGKSYDAPLLLTRFRLLGLPTSVGTREHLDLLHPVRRLFSKRWDDCRLVTLERQLLGFERKDDLPGSEAPEAWFSYLRHGNARQLIRVVEHNRQDILSLAVAHATLAEAIADPLRHKADLYGLARWLSEVNEPKALALLQSHQDRLCADSSRLLAHLFRRTERWMAAVPIWEALAKQGCVESIERLAKYHEHISKDLQVAWQYCAQLPGSTADRHRQKRLQEKLKKYQPADGLLPWLT